VDRVPFKITFSV